MYQDVFGIHRWRSGSTMKRKDKAQNSAPNCSVKPTPKLAKALPPS